MKPGALDIPPMITRAAWPTSARESMTWSSVPLPSRRRTKQSLPVLRRKITRPAMATSSPVRVSGSSSPRSIRGSNFSRISVRVWLRSTVSGYALRPASIRRSRFSRRTRICSGRDSSSEAADTAGVWSVMVPKPKRWAGQVWLRVNTSSRPSRVSQGWCSVKVAHSSTTSGASPPVAITVTSARSRRSSATIRVTIPSTWLAKP